MTNRDLTSRPLTINGRTWTIYTDGSGFTGDVWVQAFHFSVNYTNKATVTLVNAGSYRKPPKWAAEFVSKQVQEVVDVLARDLPWMADNRRMYES